VSKLTSTCAFSDLTLLVGRQEGHPVLSSDSVAVFKSRLKTFLFSQAFSLLTNTLPDPSASEVTTLWHYTNLFIIIIIIIIIWPLEN